MERDDQSNKPDQEADGDNQSNKSDQEAEGGEVEVYTNINSMPSQSNAENAFGCLAISAGFFSMSATDPDWAAPAPAAAVVEEQRAAFPGVGMVIFTGVVTAREVSIGSTGAVVFDEDPASWAAGTTINLCDSSSGGMHSKAINLHAPVASPAAAAVAEEQQAEFSGSIVDVNEVATIAVGALTIHEGAQELQPVDLAGVAPLPEASGAQNE